MAPILVVDNEVLVRELFSIWLEETGHTVRAVGSVADGREVIADGWPHVLICDIHTTHAAGIDLLKWANRRAPEMPVVLVAGRPALESAVDALRLGAYDYLAKPVDRTDLLRVVERAHKHHLLMIEKQRLEDENARYRRHLEESVAQRTAALKRRNQQLLLINEVAHEINALDGLEPLYGRVVAAVHETFGYADVWMFSVDGDRRWATLEAQSTEHQGGVRRGDRLPAGEGTVGRVMDGGEPVVANDLSTRGVTSISRTPRIRSEAAVPIRADDQLVAILAVSEARTDAFDEVDIMVLRTLVEHLGIAFANARLYTRLQDALMAREEMLANISHELRSPLAVISAWSEMLGEGTLGALPDEARQAARTILSSAEHLDHLVRLLLTFQQLDRTGMSVEPIDVVELVREVTDAWRPLMEDDELTLQFHVAEEVGPAIGHCDYLRQVVYNLLDNARKFSETGGTTSVTLRTVDDGESIRLTVADEGIGATEEELDQLFDRFFQADGSMTRQHGGMGLGLALCHEIVERIGGRIWAESDGPGSGLRVHVDLKAADRHAGRRVVEDDLADVSEPMQSASSGVR